VRQFRKIGFLEFLYECVLDFLVQLCPTPTTKKRVDAVLRRLVSCLPLIKTLTVAVSFGLSWAVKTTQLETISSGLEILVT